MPNGDSGGFNFGGIFDPLLGVLAAIVDAIIAFLNALLVALVQVLNFLFAGEQGIFGFSFSGLDKVFRGLKNILDQVFKVTVIAALKHLLALYQKLQRWIRKLKMWLDRFRKLQQLNQVMAFRRLINLIQRIRKVLVVLRILHVKWASKLDNWLAGIEGKLIQRTAQIQAKTNEIIAWLNVVADPVQAYKKGLLFGAYGRSIKGFFNALDKGILEQFFPVLKQRPKGTRG